MLGKSYGALAFGLLGLFLLGASGIALQERPVVVCALAATFCAFVGEVQLVRASAYNEGSAHAGEDPSQANLVRLHALGIAIYAPRQFDASQVLRVAAVSFAVLGWVLLWA